jgi:hypothetical protein
MGWELNLMLPYTFLLTQIFTLGQSNFSDLDAGRMSSLDLVLYYTWMWTAYPAIWLYALAQFLVTFLIYPIQWTVELIIWVIETQEKGGRGGKGKGGPGMKGGK